MKKWLAFVSWAIVGSFVFLTACEAVRSDDGGSLSDQDVSVEVVRGVEILYSDSARVRVKIEAPELQNSIKADQPRQDFLRGIRVEFLDEKGVSTSVLTAKQAVREEQKKRITARDSVVLVSSKNERLLTEELLWDEEKELLTTEKFVRIQRPGEVLFGYGLEADQDFSHWKIKAPTGRLKVETPQ